MGGLFGGKVKQPAIPPAVQPPPVPAPAPTPETLDEETLQKQRARRRQKLAARGRAGTILTEGGLGEDTGKSTLLGGAL